MTSIWFDADGDLNQSVRSVESMQGSLEALNQTLRQTSSWGNEAFRAMEKLQPVFSAAAKPVARELTPAIGSLGKAFDAALDSADGLVSALTGKTARGSAKAAASVSKVGSAAQKTAKAVRSLASFDEIERLSALSGTSSSASGSSGGSSGSTGEPAATQGILAQLSDAWADFWDKTKGYYTPAVTAWQGAWDQIRTASQAAMEARRTSGDGV